jgi:triacylglycerol lipase
MARWPAVWTVAVIALVVALGIAALVVAFLFGRRAVRSWRKPTAGPQPVSVEAAAERKRRPDGVLPIPGPVERGPPLPVVLVHGLFGFDRIGVPGARFDYFRGIARQLQTLGCHAHAVRLPPSASVPDRARELVAAIDALPHARIDLIAHSLGGLDARYALTHLGLARRVRSLVTVGTPHRGTPLADLALRGPLDWARRVVAAIGIPMEALEWLGTEALASFNAEVIDVPGVRYACVVGGMHRDDSHVPLALAPAHAYLRRVSGPNDGLVPIASQYWGETLAEIEADHFAQIGWRVALRGGFDAPALYAFVVARLGDAPAQAEALAARPGATRAR